MSSPSPSHSSSLMRPTASSSSKKKHRANFHVSDKIAAATPTATPTKAHASPSPKGTASAVVSPSPRGLTSPSSASTSQRVGIPEWKAPLQPEPVLPYKSPWQRAQEAALALDFAREGHASAWKVEGLYSSLREMLNASFNAIPSGQPANLLTAVQCTFVLETLVKHWLDVSVRSREATFTILCSILAVRSNKVYEEEIRCTAMRCLTVLVKEERVDEKIEPLILTLVTRLAIDPSPQEYEEQQQVWNAVFTRRLAESFEQLLDLVYAGSDELAINPTLEKAEDHSALLDHLCASLHEQAERLQQEGLAGSLKEHMVELLVDSDERLPLTHKHFLSAFAEVVRLHQLSEVEVEEDSEEERAERESKWTDDLNRILSRRSGIEQDFDANNNEAIQLYIACLHLASSYSASHGVSVGPFATYYRQQVLPWISEIDTALRKQLIKTARRIMPELEQTEKSASTAAGASSALSISLSSPTSSASSSPPYSPSRRLNATTTTAVLSPSTTTNTSDLQQQQQQQQHPNTEVNAVLQLIEALRGKVERKLLERKSSLELDQSMVAALSPSLIMPPRPTPQLALAPATTTVTTAAIVSTKPEQGRIARERPLSLSHPAAAAPMVLSSAIRSQNDHHDEEEEKQPSPSSLPSPSESVTMPQPIFQSPAHIRTGGRTRPMHTSSASVGGEPSTSSFITPVKPAVAASRIPVRATSPSPVRVRAVSPSPAVRAPSPSGARAAGSMSRIPVPVRSVSPSPGPTAAGRAISPTPHQRSASTNISGTTEPRLMDQVSAATTAAATVVADDNIVDALREEVRKLQMDNANLHLQLDQAHVTLQQHLQQLPSSPLTAPPTPGTPGSDDGLGSVTASLAERLKRAKSELAEAVLEVRLKDALVQRLEPELRRTQEAREQAETTVIQLNAELQELHAELDKTKQQLIDQEAQHTEDLSLLQDQFNQQLEDLRQEHEADLVTLRTEHSKELEEKQSAADDALLRHDEEMTKLEELLDATREELELERKNRNSNDAIAAATAASNESLHSSAASLAETVVEEDRVLELEALCDDLKAQLQDVERVSNERISQLEGALEAVQSDASERIEELEQANEELEQCLAEAIRPPQKTLASDADDIPQSIGNVPSSLTDSITVTAAVRHNTTDVPASEPPIDPSTLNDELQEANVHLASLKSDIEKTRMELDEANALANQRSMQLEDAQAQVLALQSELDKNRTDAQVHIAALQSDLDQNRTDVQVQIADLQSKLEKNRTEDQAAIAALQTELANTKAELQATTALANEARKVLWSTHQLTAGFKS